MCAQYDSWAHVADGMLQMPSKWRASERVRVFFNLKDECLARLQMQMLRIVLNLCKISHILPCIRFRYMFSRKRVRRLCISFCQFFTHSTNLYFRSTRGDDLFLFDSKSIQTILADWIKCGIKISQSVACTFRINLHTTNAMMIWYWAHFWNTGFNFETKEENRAYECPLSFKKSKLSEHLVGAKLRRLREERDKNNQAINEYFRRKSFHNKNTNWFYTCVFKLTSTIDTTFTYRLPVA